MSQDPFADDYIVKFKQQTEIQDSSASISSDLTLVDAGAFTPGTSFSINAKGHNSACYPSELEIPIYHADGSLAYTSTRAKLRSGNAVLSHPQRGDLISTSYFFGPGRDPVVELLDASSNPSPNRFKLTGRWMNRTVSFVVPSGTAFEWSYGTMQQADGEKARLLVLRQRAEGASKGDKGKVIAQLIRSRLTRTPGSTRNSAGNGGKLVLEQSAGDVLDESVIIATCLTMLKKEIDRRRSIQSGVI